MKNLVLIGVFLLSATTFAETDVSGLRSKTIEPMVDNIRQELSKFKTSIKDLDLTASQQAALDELEEAMKVHVHPATLKRLKSKGPKWRELAIEYLENEHSIEAAVSYADEDGVATDQCDFEAESIDESKDHFFTWDSVKRIKGKQKSIAYFLNVIVPLRGLDKDTGEWKWCDHFVSEYAFEVELEDGKPIEIINW